VLDLGAEREAVDAKPRDHLRKLGRELADREVLGPCEEPALIRAGLDANAKAEVESLERGRRVLPAVRETVC